MNENNLIEFLRLNQFELCPDYSISKNSMGDYVDAFFSRKCLLRVVADRGQRFIDLAHSDAIDWVDIFTLATRVDDSFQPKTGSFSEAIQTLKSYWPMLAPKF